MKKEGDYACRGSEVECDFLAHNARLRKSLSATENGFIGDAANEGSISFAHTAEFLLHLETNWCVLARIERAMD